MSAESKLFKRQIADNFFLTTSQYKDAEYVHIRRYENTEDGQKSFPTKKGASFPPGRWIAFYDLIADIDDYIRRHKEGQSVYYHHHNGGAVNDTINENTDTWTFDDFSTQRAQNGASDQVGYMRDIWSMEHFENSDCETTQTKAVFAWSRAVLQTTWSREFDDSHSKQCHFQIS